MALVPEEVLDRFERKQRLETAPIISDMMQKDMEMLNILRDPNLPDAENQKLYNANMERYLELQQQKNDHVPTVGFAPVAAPAQVPPAPAPPPLPQRPLPKVPRRPPAQVPPPI